MHCAKEEAKSLTFHEWEQLFQSNDEEIVIESIEETTQHSPDQTKEVETIETHSEIPESPESLESPETPETPEKSEALAHLRNLCRVCNSSGLISISSHLSPKLFKVRVTGDMTPWQIPIAKILAEVSGENIEIDDGLPQNICEHCLGYLQHAYSMRLKIRDNQASLKIMTELATNESVILDSKIDIKKVTKREVEETRECEHEERHFTTVFGNSNIKINQSSNQNFRSERIIEQKCFGCSARLMSVKSLNLHMQSCENIALNEFFTKLKNLYSLQGNKLTNIEFVLRAFKLIYDTTKQLQKIARVKGINVSAVTSEMPNIEVENTQIDPRINNLRRNNNRKSPDHGYASASPNYSQRF